MRRPFSWVIEHFLIRTYDEPGLWILWPVWGILRIIFLLVWLFSGDDAIVVVRTLFFLSVFFGVLAFELLSNLFGLGGKLSIEIIGILAAGLYSLEIISRILAEKMLPRVRRAMPIIVEVLFYTREEVILASLIVVLVHLRV